MKILGFVTCLILCDTILIVQADDEGFFNPFRIVKYAAEGATKAFLEFSRDTMIKFWKTFNTGSSGSRGSFNMHAPFTIVLIGQTGSGKTSFLNLLLNINNIIDIDDNTKTLNTLRRYNDIKLELDGDTMGSKTSASQIYETTFQKYKMRIVDTPGFGDSRGMNYDIQHRKNIVEIIKKLTYVNCIILVVNGRESRMTKQLEYVIDDITSIMPKTIRNNIVVMFTNVDHIFNLNFDPLSLKDYIRTDVKHYWFTENPVCRLEKAQNKKHRDLYESNFIVEEDMLIGLRTAFQQTAETMLNMYNVISNFTAIHSNDFLEVYDLKENIEKEYIRLIIQHDDLLEDISRLNDLQKKLKSHSNRKEVFKNFNKTETFETTKLVDTPYHNTLCAHSGCNHNCHEHCGLPLTLERGSIVFKGCHAMDRTGLKCRKCGHSYKYHYHVRAKYERVQETRTYVDAALLEQFNEAKNDEERTKIALIGIRKQIEEKENQLRKLFGNIRKQVSKYEKLGLPQSYLRLLRSRLAQTELTIKTYQGDPSSKFYQELLKSKNDLKTKIHYEENMMATSGHTQHIDRTKDEL